jgi:hypothetical protein
MKVKPKPQAAPPVTHRVKLDGHAATLLSAYAAYYQSIYQQSISVDELLAEMALTLMEDDRDFKKWQLQQTPAPAVANAPNVSPPPKAAEKSAAKS